MGLLQGVSKSVQEEATQIFYGPKNHFVLPTGLYAYPETCGHYYANFGAFYQVPPFKSMSYTFDMRDMHEDAWILREVVKEMELGGPEKGDNFEKLDLSSEDIMSRIHNVGKVSLDDFWNMRCQLMRSQLALKFLQIDLEECYCPTGCCRMALDVCKWLGPFESFPDKFEVIGVKNKAEALSIREEIAEVNEVHKVHPKDIRCVDLNGQSLDYEAPAPSGPPTLIIKFSLRG